MTGDEFFNEERRNDPDAVKDETRAGHTIREVESQDGYRYLVAEHDPVTEWMHPRNARKNIAACISEKTVEGCPVQPMGDLFGKFK
jgi:hypothetical protein